MPTNRHRLVITETDELSEALDDAQRKWPGLSRSKLLVALVDEGHRALRDELGRERRLAGIRSTAGAMSGVWPPGALDELREDWPS